MRNVTRRQLLGPVGVAAGACALSSCWPGKTGPYAGAERRPHFPWTYVQLDPDVAADKAYRDYQKGHCMYGVFAGVVSRLAEQYGEPYRSFPFGMMAYGAAGAGGWGSLCGALNGGGAAIGLFVATERQRTLLIDELFLWYETAELPVYVPESPILEMEMPRSTAGSVLCHVSITNWCKASGYKAAGKQQKERCRRLTADTARKTAEILNCNLAGRYTAAADFSEDVCGCRACHAKGSEMENSKGKMSCGSCHFSLSGEHP